MWRWCSCCAWIGPALAQSPKFYPDDPLLREPEPVRDDRCPGAAVERAARDGQQHVHAPGRAPSRRRRHPGARRQYARRGDGRAWFVNRHGTRRLIARGARSRAGQRRSPAPHRPAAGPRRQARRAQTGPARRRRAQRVSAPVRSPGIRGARDRRRDGGLTFLLCARLSRRRELYRSAQSGAARRVGGRAGRIRCRAHACPDRARHRPVSSQRGGGARAHVSGRGHASAERADAGCSGRTRCSASAATIPTTSCRTSIVATCGACSSSARGSTTATCGPMNTADVLVDEGGIPHIRHYLFDFTTALGSGVLDGPKRAWEGHERLYPGARTVAANVLGFGVYTPSWMRARYPKLRGVGHIDYETFDPERWTTNYRIAPFVNRLPDDTFWAAKLVMAFTDEDIRAIVSTGQYSDPAAADVAGRVPHRAPEPDRPRVSRSGPSPGQLPNRERRAGLRRPRGHTRPGLAARRSERSGSRSTTARESCRRSRAPAACAFRHAVGRGQLCRGAPLGRGAREDDHGVSRDPRADRWRWWASIAIGPGRSWRPPGDRCGAGPAGIRSSMRSRRRSSCSTPPSTTRGAVARTRRKKAFDALSLSQQTTFDAVTHALMQSELTDEAGGSLGSPIDLLDRHRPHRRAVRGPRRRSAVPALRPAEARRPRRPRKEPRVLPRSREHRVPRRLSALVSPDWQGTQHAVLALRGRAPGGHRRRLPVQPVAAGAVQWPPDSPRTPTFASARILASTTAVGTGSSPGGRTSFGRVNDATESNRDLLYADRPPVPTPIPSDRPLGAAPGAHRGRGSGISHRLARAAGSTIRRSMRCRRAPMPVSTSTTTPARKRCQRTRRGCAFRS